MDFEEKKQQTTTAEEKRKQGPASNLIRFLGGRSTLFVLVSILLIGLIILIYDRISFIFYPITVFFSTVVLPIILATIAYLFTETDFAAVGKGENPAYLGYILLFSSV